MQILQPDVQILDQETGLEGIYKAIEYPGRICYGSTNNIEEGSAKPFVERLMKSNHGAPMEHGAVYLAIPFSTLSNDEMENINKVYCNNPYVRVKKINSFNSSSLYDKIHNVTYYISTNYRVLFENDRLNDLKYLVEFSPEYHEKCVTVKFICNIGVSREFNRHRHNSINEESTRYCNYSKDKFGNEISIICNNQMFDDRKQKLLDNNANYTVKEYCKQFIKDDTKFSDIDYWLFALKTAELSYIKLITEFGWKPQAARDILGLCTKTILVHSAFIDDWKHFFDLRADGTTGAPHPQAKELALPLKNEFVKRGYILEN